MKRNPIKLLNAKLFFLLIFIILGQMICFAQEAKIKKIVSETEDDVEFQIYLDKSSVNFRQDLTVNYTVKNKNRKTIFLAVESPTALQIKDIWFIETLEPMRPPDNSNKYNLKFIRINSGKTYSGKLTLKAKEFTPKPGYTFTGAFLRVGFSYIFDLSSQREIKGGNPSYSMSDLYKKSKSLTVGDLAFDVIYK